jgi:hypothetical protein
VKAQAEGRGKKHDMHTTTVDLPWCFFSVYR